MNAFVQHKFGKYAPILTFLLSIFFIYIYYERTTNFSNESHHRSPSFNRNPSSYSKSSEDSGRLLDTAKSFIISIYLGLNLYLPGILFSTEL